MKENLAYAEAGLLESLRTPPMTLDSLRARSQNTLQSRESYEASLLRAQGVLQRQSGIFWSWEDVPIYAFQDTEADSGKIVRFLEREVPIIGDSLPLFDAVGQGLAKAVFLGDVAHSHSKELWRRKGDRVVDVSDEGLAATMNAQQMVFDLISENPSGFIYVRGNHDGQRKTPFDDHVNDKNLAIAGAMKRAFKKHGPALHRSWIQTEDCLPLMFASNAVFLSHAAPDANINIRDIELRTDAAYKRLAGTENRQGVPGHMTEKAMIRNMGRVHEQLLFEPDPLWIWGIGHRPTDDEPNGFRLQCGGRLLQINKRSGELYAVFNPDGSVLVGNCRSTDPPMEVVRNLAA